MKKTLTKRFSLLALCMLMLLQCLSLGVCAEDGGGFTQWMLSDDGNALMCNNGKTYYFYGYNSNIELDPSTVYEFANPVEYGYIYSSSPSSEIVWIEDTQYDEIYLYATDKGFEQLGDFENGSVGSYRLCDGYGSNAKLDADTAELLGNSGTTVIAKTVEVDVGTLKNVECYYLRAYDESDTFSILDGAIYVDGDGALYYLNYLTLGNQYFDADGNFSYRSGTVSLVVLDDKTAATVAISIDNMAEEEIEYVYEDDGSIYVEESTFWFLFLLIGFIFPIPFIIIGLVTATSEYRGKPKYWYLLAAIAGAWILLSIVLMMVLMI